MKKLIGFLVSITVAATAIAQEGKTGKENPDYPFKTGNITPQQQGSREYYVVRDKKLFHVKDNLSDEVITEVSLSNGTKLTPQGEMISRTGKHEMLEEGQCVDVTAAVSFCEAMPDKTIPEKKPGEQKNLPEDKEKGKKLEPGNR